jgi:hypothetical protein
MNFIYFAIKNIKNTIDFYVRNKFRFSRGEYPLINEPKHDLFRGCSGDVQEKESLFFKKYNLEILKNNSTKRNYLENLYIIELLEKLEDIGMNIENTGNMARILDIGSKNWFYAQGEHSFFSNHYNPSNIFLTGIEIDAFRLYSSFYTRYDAAMRYIKGLDNTRYIAGDLLKHNENYDYIIWLFPFLTKYPLLKWGLPLKHLKPERMLLHAHNLLNSGGKMIIVNQGEEENKIQHEFLYKHNIPFEAKGIFKSHFLEYEAERFINVVVKS